MMDKLFEVPNHVDQIKRLKKLKPLSNYCHLFETENEAGRYIRDRAAIALEQSEKDLLRAKQRVAKCQKKYAFKLQEKG